MGRYSIGLFNKMGDKGEEGIKNLKKCMTSLMDVPGLTSTFTYIHSKWHLTKVSLLTSICSHLLLDLVVCCHTH